MSTETGKNPPRDAARAHLLIAVPKFGRAIPGVWGCLFSRPRPLYLGEQNSDSVSGRERVGPVALSGAFVAWNREDTQHGPQARYASVTVSDLRTHRRLHSWGQGGEEYAGATWVTRLRVSSRGSAAWIAGQTLATGQVRYQVFKADTTTRRYQLLDEGVAVDRHYLSVSGGRVRWRDDHVVRTAPFK